MTTLSLTPSILKKSQAILPVLSQGVPASSPPHPRAHDPHTPEASSCYGQDADRPRLSEGVASTFISWRAWKSKVIKTERKDRGGQYGRGGCANSWPGFGVFYLNANGEETEAVGRRGRSSSHKDLCEQRRSGDREGRRGERLSPACPLTARLRPWSHKGGQCSLRRRPGWDRVRRTKHRGLGAWGGHARRRCGNDGGGPHVKTPP